MRSYYSLLCGCLFIVSLFLFSCSPDERFIDTSNPSWRIIAATGAQPNALALITQPANTVSTADIYADANSKKLAANVLSINEYDNHFYLLMPDNNSIEVVDAKTFKSVATISTGQHKPVALCFANGTTGFIANDDSTVSVLDITVQRITQDIPVGKRPKAIAVMGNQVAVCNQLSNTVSIIDTRSRSVTKTIPVQPAPTFIVPDGDSTEFVILSLGDGKTGNEAAPTAPYITTYNPFTGNRTGEVELQELGVDAVNILPRGLAVSPSAEIAFIPVGSQVVTVDTRNHVFYSFNEGGTFDACTYNFRRNEILLTRTSDAVAETLILDASVNNVGKLKSRVTLPMSVRAVFPYYIP